MKMLLGIAITTIATGVYAQSIDRYTILHTLYGVPFFPPEVVEPPPPIYTWICETKSRQRPPEKTEQVNPEQGREGVLVVERSRTRTVYHYRVDNTRYQECVGRLEYDRADGIYGP
jgi:hypothetical protein